MIKALEQVSWQHELHKYTTRLSVPQPLASLVISTMSTRAIYRGPRRKLVLAFDVGTTYSGISYR